MLLALLAACASAQPRLVLVPERVLDGRGAVLAGATVEVVGDRIERVRNSGEQAPAGVPRVELAGMTLLPGLIDTHVHLDWYFDDGGRLATEDNGDPPARRALEAMANAERMLRAGVTTVQSLGAPLDLELRRAAARGPVALPRILTSVRSATAATGDPEAMRDFVRWVARDGADVVKIFASQSIRDGGGPTLSQEQLDAACGEARALDLRAVVHAHGPESARRAALAGCTTIEHGALLDRPTLELLAERRVFYDPNVDLVLRNYQEHKPGYLGIGNYTEEGFAQMAAASPRALATFREALTGPRLLLVFGTDAVSGAHGRNAEELVYRIEQGGQDAGTAIVSATSLAARSLGLGDEIGSVAPGFVADLLAVSGNPLEDPRALLRPHLVMRAGRIVRLGGD